MNRKILFAVILLLTLAVIWLLEERAIARLRGDSAALVAAQEERDRLVAENAELAKLRGAVDGETVPLVPKGELLRLRNELRQLRAQQPELDKLRAENERLAAELNASAARPARLADMEGFVAQETWDNAGLATPEAALRTLFRALRDADVEVFVQCLGPDEARGLQRQLERNPEAARKDLAGSLQIFSKISGYRIARREAHGDDRVTFEIQVAAGGAVMDLELRRCETEWKVERMFESSNRANKE